MLIADWDEVAEWLADANAVNSPAELHGHLVGRIVAGESLSAKRGISVLGDCLGIPAEDLLENERIWIEFAQSIGDQVEDDQYRFSMLLPDDSVELPLRLLSLGHWCQSFLVGIASVVKDLDKNLDDDARELLSDLAEISQISVDEQESDENEYLYAELVEYVRVSVFNLAAGFRKPDSVPSGQPH